ncbi:FRG domain family [Clostridium botulinum C str. Eklund]|nr:FRG domain family [Clostridium botulinum C str. Eklund]NEZ49258.1 FRG domain-containing protein [Clostridium botulinum]
MIEVRIENFQQLHNALLKYKNDDKWIFRGQGKASWKLVPKAGRMPYNKANDEKFFNEWKRGATEFIDTDKYDDWNLLAIAQHYGFATRFLDWTHNPLIAAYFAVNKYYNSDAVIYAYFDPKTIIPKENKLFKNKGINKFVPNGDIQRIVRQCAIFTVHGPATLSLEKNISNKCILEKIIIDKVYRKQLLFDLSYYGINRLSLFPDLDGLSSYINWHMRNEK